MLVGVALGALVTQLIATYVTGPSEVELENDRAIASERLRTLRSYQDLCRVTVESDPTSFGESVGHLAEAQRLFREAQFAESIEEAKLGADMAQLACHDRPLRPASPSINTAPSNPSQPSSSDPQPPNAPPTSDPQPTTAPPTTG